MSVVCLVVGVLLSHLVEPGVHVETVTLAGNTPALHFVPADSDTHPIALLAHGVTASKETLFRLGEALAAAGFTCYAVDLPGHGESTRRFSPPENAPTLTAIARELGSVDVFIGHSMGSGAGAESVREGGLDPRLFIAIGSLPNLGTNHPPLLLLAGEFDEAIAGYVRGSGQRLLPLSTNQLNEFVSSETNANFMLFSWCDHALEPYDPRLVNAAVRAACATVGKIPPPAPTRWVWRIVGFLLAVPSVFCLALWLPRNSPRLECVQGTLLAIAFIVGVGLTSSTWLGVNINARRIPVQIVAMLLFWILLAGIRKLRIPRWTIATPAAVVTLGCIIAKVYLFALFAGIGTACLLTGTVLGELAARRGSQQQRDIATAIFIGYAIGQWWPIIF